eukprot:CAMPEP_0206178660 /NCGR_PEP_ID=MMETSP1474-20131121/64956_1 /ASSEMBLY_ACC=CAM_ASM_001110 /TAXON_ID=97495 /ORGANISM="Imantonia sp., Strain RCC918" /LENGTH=30 /DNA_ID= /DNA_START= /DNA_END= /DNA_ORIENTATION=
MEINNKILINLNKVDINKEGINNKQNHQIH